MSQEYKPFVAADRSIPELTPIPILVGVILGIVFGASSLYLALKVGMTVSASIPVAVLSITLFKVLSKTFRLRQATILENNIVQTAGSAGESIAFGVAVTMPALLILGYDMDLGRIMTVAVLGGLLGILMMIPLRYALVVKAHGQLSFPEGTACAQVLMAGEKGGTSAKTVFGGFFFGLFYKVLNVGAKLWADVPERAISWFKGATIACEVSPELLGVGYIIGPRIACIMVAGGILSSWVLIPMIVLFGSGLPAPLFPATTLISTMDVHDIWKNYVLYIGAGAVAAGGIISLCQSLPIIVRSAVAGIGGLRGAAAVDDKRTGRDIPMPWVLLGMLALVVAIWLAPTLEMNLIGAILIVLFGFIFVTVSARLTGQIGSSSNPISGMTVATLLLTSLIFLLMGWIGPDYRVAALSVAAIVCVAASNGGTTAQDLKTGFLIGATPKFQQIAILIGALISALVIGFTLNVLNDASTIYSKKSVPTGVKVENASSVLTRIEHVRGHEHSADKADYRVLYLTEPPVAGQQYHVDPTGHVTSAHAAGSKDSSDSKSWQPITFSETQLGNLAKLAAGKYLVDDEGIPHYLVDPGINGVLNKRDDGTSVQKYEAPKARLMSLIIDGILTQKLPWGLVLLGVAIAIVLELCGIASLPFAVGVYLPLSASMPIFVGGCVRWLTDKYMARRRAKTDDEAGPGVLFSSGLIAGGAIGGIALAVLLLNEGWGSAFDLGGKLRQTFYPGDQAAGWDTVMTTGSVVMFSIMALLLLIVSVRGVQRDSTPPNAK